MFRIFESDRRMRFQTLSEQAKHLAEVEEARKAAEAAANSWTALAGNILGTSMSVIRNISSIIGLVNGTVTMLKSLGIINDRNNVYDNILEGIDSIQISVDEIDRNVDKIQETLVAEFSELDLKFQEQEYNHYKDDVWSHFYTDAVVPLAAYQNEYNDDVRWLLVSYIEQWQSNSDCPTGLRALYGEDGNGGYMQVYSANNMNDVGEKLPRAPKVSIDSIPVEYSVTLPSEYISNNFDELTALNSENCVDLLTRALEKGIYEAAESNELEAYGGFETVWKYLSEDEKYETAKEFAADLADSLAFTCAYNAANERKFASNVKSAYENFVKWLNGADSLTSPLYAQFKMLSLTHGFEGEISEEIETVLVYLSLMDMNFATFAQTVISLSKAHGESDCETIDSLWSESESNLIKEAAAFLTGNPNYCYPLGKAIEYRNINVSSSVSFTYGQWEDRGAGLSNVYTYHDIYSSTPWIVYDADSDYSADAATAAAEKNASNNKLMNTMISAKDTALIYAMYEASGSENSFSQYLAENNVIIDSEKAADSLVTSVNTGSLDLGKGVRMKAFLPTGMSEYISDGATYAVSTGIKDFDNKCYRVHDQATGGLFDMNSGSFSENNVLAARAFYGEDNSLYMDEMVVFSTTPVRYSKRLLSFDEEPIHEQDEYYDLTADFTEGYGTIVSSELTTYTFPEKTEKIKDGFFARSESLEKIIFEGVPEEIEPNAFLGVGSQANRCLLVAPSELETGSLTEQWHGGWFGDTTVMLNKNDGSGETETTVSVIGSPVSAVPNPFSAPEHMKFAGWSMRDYDNKPADSAEPVTAGLTLYAIWGYDHEHDFEVSKAGCNAKCTEKGYTDELICKTCGLVEESKVIPALGHSCEFTKQEDGTYLAECKDCSYSAVLYQKTVDDFKVWSENTSGNDVTLISDKYNGNTLSVNSSGVYVIENSRSYAASSKIDVNGNIIASIGLAGVDIEPFSRRPAITSSSGTLHLTLVDGTENTLVGGGDANAVQASGNLVFDGSGSLIAKAPNNVAIYASGDNTEFKSGNIKTESYEYYGGGIRLDNKSKTVVVTEDVFLFSKNGLGVDAVNENGEKVYPVCIVNESNETITVDGRTLPYTTAPGENSAYIYLTDEDHEITLGGKPFELKFVDGRCYFEKEYGDFTVTLSDTDFVTYSDGVLTVKSPEPITIRNTDPSEPTDDRIIVLRNIGADITLDGVYIDESENGASALKIADSNSAGIKITLAENSENILRGGYNCAGLSKNGKYGTLTIDGTGTLSVTGGYNSAAIGSDYGHVAYGIVINNGVINAYAESNRAAAIGSGCMDAKSASSVSDKIYTAEGIIINGGTITAVSTDSAAIGAGDNDSVPGKVFCAKDIIINGGTVVAESEHAAYTIGAGICTEAENIVINGGIVTAESTADSSLGGIGAGLGTDGLIIEPTASVKARLGADPVNSKGEGVSLNVVAPENLKNISINGNPFPYSSHNGEKNLYIYLAEDDELNLVPILEIEESENGTVTVSPLAPASGKKVKLNAKPDEGYVLSGFEVYPETVELEDNSFVMPDYGVSIKGLFSRVGCVTVKDCENCTVTPSKSIAAGGEKITLRIVPDEGMELSEWIVTPDDVEITNNTFIMPQEDITVTGICVPKTHTITWNIDDKPVTQNVKFGEKITEPDADAKDGYSFEGWTPSVETVMPDRDLEYTAVFSKIISSAKFVADGKTVAELPYSVDDTFEEPAVPEKAGYTGRWEEYELTPGGVTVNAIYSAEEYKAIFIADGKTVKEVPFSITDTEISEPDVPQKTGYTAKWSNYTLKNGNITVEAVYTPVTYTAAFTADGETVQNVKFTVESNSIGAPAVPEKAGYNAKWSNYDIRPESFTVNAVYTPIVYSAKFVADGKTVKIVKYTCEDKALEEPEIPEKEGYSAEWDMYEPEIGGITVNAVYSVNSYDVIWNVDGETTTVSVKYGDKIPMPDEPEKSGCEFIGWQPSVPDTMPAKDIQFEAIFGEKKAVADITVDGVKVGEIEYSEDDTSIPNLPPVPEKEGYTGEWRITEGENGLSVEALYTPKTFTVDIIADGEKVGETSYTYGDTELDLSSYPVPEKEGYTGKWEYTLTADGATVNAVYTPIQNPTADAVIKVASEKNVDYRSKVIIKATATGVPEGCFLIMTVDGKEIKGTNTEVSYEITELKADVTYSVRVADANGNIMKSADGSLLEKEGGKITCSSGLFKKIVAFFKGLFKLLPAVEVEPKS